MRYYDAAEKRLVYIETQATPEFWDRLWEDEALKKSIIAGAHERFVYPVTRKYLKPGAQVLEGGCGKGQFVYSLHSRGYAATGVDFAEKTVTKVKSLVPELDIVLGDVRQLPFPDGRFHGYWSLGVIEHFYDGFESIAQEMARVLRPGGYLFLTFPYMSPLRKLKAWFGAYPPFQPDLFTSSHFYQFALTEEHVSRAFERLGFRVVERKPYAGLKGFKDESGPIKPLFQKIYDNKSTVGQALAYALTLLFAPFAGHTVLLVLRKRL